MISNTPFYDESYDGEVEAIKARYKKRGLAGALDDKLFAPERDTEDADEHAE